MKTVEKVSRTKGPQQRTTMDNKSTDIPGETPAHLPDDKANSQVESQVESQDDSNVDNQQVNSQEVDNQHGDSQLNSSNDALEKDNHTPEVPNSLDHDSDTLTDKPNSQTKEPNVQDDDQDNERDQRDSNPPEQSDEGTFCHEHCIYNRNDDSYMIQCRLCYSLYHIDCVGIPRKNYKKIGFWPCFDCREISKNIKDLQISLKHLTSTVTKLFQSITPSTAHNDQTSDRLELLERLAAKSLECENLGVVNAQLKQKIEQNETDPICLSDSESESGDSESESDLVDPRESATGHLIIGDSLIRYVVPTGDGVSVACMRGAKCRDVTKKLKSDNRYYEKISIVCGTNDLATKMDAEKITNNFKNMLQYAKTKSKCVTLSSIPPRIDSKVSDQRLMRMNECLSNIAASQNITFIDNDLNFRFMSEIPDESLLQVDGLHLSAKGTNRLLANLKLNNITKCNLITEKTDNSASNTVLTPKNQKVHTRSKNGVTLFFNKESKFSNLHLDAPICIDGMQYTCNEQFYTYRMAKYFNDQDAAKKCLEIEDPYKLVSLQKEIKNFDAGKWAQEAESTLYLANMAKYTQNVEAREALLNTRNDIIGEASYSRKWGIGASIHDIRSMDSKNWTGQNKMGKILMSIREALQCKHPKNNSMPSQRPVSSNNERSCWFCGEFNHISKNCRHGQKIQCRSCYNLGHKAKYCEFC